MWRVCKYVKVPYPNVEKIFPLKQHYVELCVALLKCDYNWIKRMTVFGSSVTCACNPWSDIDIFFDIEGERPACGFRPPLVTEQVYDIWYSDDVPCDEPLLRDIRGKGVVVFERR